MCVLGGSTNEGSNKVQQSSTSLLFASRDRTHTLTRTHTHTHKYTNAHPHTLSLSKIQVVAERRAWELAEEKGIDLVVVNPGA